MARSSDSSALGVCPTRERASVTNSEKNLPIDDKGAEGERESIRAAARLFEPRFIFRSDSPPDRGADASIELRREVSGHWRATGMRAWCQLKHTSAPHRLIDGSMSHPIDTKNINYLGNYPCPFYLLYVRPSSEMFFRWHRDVLNELNLKRPGWNETEMVKIRFSRQVDESVFKEIETEIDCYFAQVAQLLDGPRFVRFAQEESTRGLLSPNPLFVGRHRELAELKGRVRRGSVMTVTGEPDAGKRELVRRSLCDPAMLTCLRNSLDGPLALLVVDASAHLEPRILRGVAWAIGVQKSWDIALEEATSRLRERTNLVAESLPSRVQGQRLLAIVENAEHCLDEMNERLDLDALLASEPFRSGCAVVISAWGTPPNGKGKLTVQPETRVGSLPPDDAITLFRALGFDHRLSSSVVDQAKHLPELLLPGVIIRAAGTFAIHTSVGQHAATSEALLDQLLFARDRLIMNVLEGLNINDQIMLSDGSPGPLAVLTAISILGRQAIDVAELADLGLSESLLAKLCKLGWVAQPTKETYCLTDEGYRSLFRVFESLTDSMSLRDDTIGIVTDTVQRLLGVLAACLSEDDFDRFSLALEAAIVRIRHIGLGGTRLESVLIETHLPYVVDDAFFPTSLEMASFVREKLSSVGRLDDVAGTVAKLVLTVRSGVDADQFLIGLRAGVKAAAKSKDLSGVHLRALDFATFLGQRRFHQYREILESRRELSDRLLVWLESEAADVAVLKWSTSWLLNTAHLAARVGETEVAREISDAARAAVVRLPQPKTPHGASDRLWLASRLAQIEGKLQAAPSQRIERFEKAVVAAFDALASSPADARWIRFALRAAHRLVNELRSDDQRDRLLGKVEDRLTDIFGDYSAWSLSLKAQVTALARDTAVLSADPEQRLRQLRRFLDRFQPSTDETKLLASAGDDRAALVLARSCAFAANCSEDLGKSEAASKYMREAFQLTREIATAAPSASSVLLYLKLLDKQESAHPETAWHMDAVADIRSMISPNLRKSIRAAQSLLSNLPYWGSEEGDLALWCLQREWRSQGNLECWAASTQDVKQPWDELDLDTKRQRLKRKHRQRQAALDKVERRTGPLLDLYILRMRNEAQLQRLLAVYGKHIPDEKPVLQHIESAKLLWPYSYTILKEEGRFWRYVWNYVPAIVSFRQVVSTAPSGAVRREAMVDLVEALLTAAIHNDTVVLADGSIADSTSFVAEARTLLTELAGFRHISREVAMLRDRADLEAGIPLDWQAIDDAFHAVVGDIDAYPATIVDNLDDLREGHPDLAESIADLVVTHFTSSEVLRDLGSLYLRRVDLGRSPDPTLDCRKAYAAYEACRILETAWRSDRETSVTSYLRGRAILTAARTTGELTPFRAPLEGKRHLLHLAEALISRAVSLSVGQFHLEAKRRHSETARLLHTLEGQA